MARLRGVLAAVLAASVVSAQHNYSRALGPGALVDLNEHVCHGLQLRDLVKDEWFDPPEPKEEKAEQYPEPEPEPAINEESDHGPSNRP